MLTLREALKRKKLFEELDKKWKTADEAITETFGTYSLY